MPRRRTAGLTAAPARSPSAPQTVFVPGYRQYLQGLGVAEIDPAIPRMEVDTDFLAFIIREHARLLPFDARFYLAENPEVAALIADGRFLSAHDHFLRAGYRQGRLPHPLAADGSGAAAGAPELAADGEVQDEAARWAQAVARTGHELAHRSFNELLVQAFLPPLLGPPGRGFRGGPVLGEAGVERALRHHRGSVPVDSFPPRPDEPAGRLDGDYVYAGLCADHFGHVMAEAIHRILPSRFLFDCRRLLFVGLATGQPPGGYGCLPPVLQAALRFLRVNPSDVTVIHDSRVVERLHIAQQGSALDGHPRPSYLRMLAATTPARLDVLHDGTPAAELVYVSRSRIIHGGLLLGERYLEELLREAGWTVLHPQELPLADQMQAYHRARQVLFAEGSACHGVELFGAGGLAHCILLPRRAETLHVFRHALEPRARRFDVLPSATMLGGILLDVQTGGALGSLGVSVLDFGLLAPAMRALGLARLEGLDAAAYRRAAEADLAAHIAHHRREATPLVSDAAIQALQDRLAAALPSPRDVPHRAADGV